MTLEEKLLAANAKFLTIRRGPTQIMDGSWPTLWSVEGSKTDSAGRIIQFQCQGNTLPKAVDRFYEAMK